MAFSLNEGFAIAWAWCPMGCKALAARDKLSVHHDRFHADFSGVSLVDPDAPTLVAFSNADFTPRSRPKICRSKLLADIA